MSKEITLTSKDLEDELEKALKEEEGKEVDLNIEEIDELLEKALKEEEGLKNFKSMCGFSFDPSKKSDCYKECQVTSNKDYLSCLDNYNKLSIIEKSNKNEKKIKSTGSRKTGTQYSRIIFLLENEDLMTEKMMAEMAEVPVSRLRKAFKKLIYREKRMVFVDEKGLVFFQARFPEKDGKQAYKIQDEKNSVYIKKYC